MIGRFSLLIAALGSALANADEGTNGPGPYNTYTTSVTPHQQYPSSVGVLGCKIDINRAAYFPYFPVCDKLCVRVKHLDSDRNVVLLRVDGLGGAHDISYDAWNYLHTGSSAKHDPQTGGGIPVRIEPLDFDHQECRLLLKEGTLPVMAVSPQWGLSCLDQNKVKLWNTRHPRCNMGINEECQYDGAVISWPSGEVESMAPLSGLPVVDIEYPVG